MTTKEIIDETAQYYAEDTLKVTVTPKHVKKSSGYFDSYDCALAVALKKLYPKAKFSDISVGGDHVDFQRKGKSTLKYDIDPVGSELLQRLYFTIGEGDLITTDIIIILKKAL